MTRKWIYILAVTAFCTACACRGGEAEPAAEGIPEASSDNPATPSDEPSVPEQTLSLRECLALSRERGVMFGAQIPTEYGLSGGTKWWHADGSEMTSDTKILCGKNPAVCGWDISRVELEMETNLDGETFPEIRKHIIAAYQRGAVNTISWHCANPLTLGDSWSRGDWSYTPAVASVLPGGEKHEMFRQWLDRVAGFISSLTSPDGNRIPLIFRPWHEHSGAGFWWGKGKCTKDEFIALWRFTHEYLSRTKGLDNLLWAYSPDEIHFIWDNEDRYRSIYLDFWPGDGYVDILGLDAYDDPERRYVEVTPKLCRLIVDLAAEKKKLAALTETGLENNSPQHSSYYNKKWWTEALAKAIAAPGLCYALVWRNGGLPPDSHYFNAWKGCYSEEDFLKFIDSDNILLEGDIPRYR